MSYLVIDNISKEIDKINILKDISFSIKDGEFISILGPSGCGKTTLLRIISGLDKASFGNIFFNDREITNVDAEKRNFGFVFQNYVLFPNMTIRKNIAYGLYNKKLSKEEINLKVKDIIDLMKLDELEDKYPNELSGGQQQRVALARALILSPKVLLLDEPLSALDAKIREKLREEIKRIQRKFNITTIMVTHDQEEALTLSDRIIVMEKGKVSQIGTPEQIYNNPKNRFVADFIGKANIINGLSESIKVLRPENINYSIEKKEGFFECIIKGIEFRGGFYRLTLNSKGQFINDDILLDIISSEKRRLNLNENMKLYIDISNGICINS